MNRNGIRNIRMIWAAAISAMLLALLPAGVAQAYPALEAGKCSLKVTAADGDKVVQGLKITLYKAADMTISGGGAVSYTLTDAFAQYEGQVGVELDVNHFDSSSWAASAKSVQSHVEGDAAEGNFESYSGETDENGAVSFSDLDQGLYLMLSSTYTGDTYASVESVPVFLTLPQISKDETEWIYDASVTAKLKVTTKEETSVTVRKVWVGDDTAATASRRPSSITVELLNAAGTVEKTQVLSASNGWSYTWEHLAAGKWSVRENPVPANYSVTYAEQATANGKTVTVTNSTPPGGVLGESREKTPTKTKKVKGSSRQGDTASVQSAARLPQTGQLWWPVWVLSAAAAVLVLLGLILRLSGKKDLKD